MTGDSTAFAGMLYASMVSACMEQKDPGRTTQPLGNPATSFSHCAFSLPPTVTAEKLGAGGMIQPARLVIQEEDFRKVDKLTINSYSPFLACR